MPFLRGDPDIIEREIAGLERGLAIAVSPRGYVKSRDDRKRFARGIKLIVDALSPSLIISYGPNSYGVLDYPLERGIELHAYASRGRGDLGGGVLSVEIR